MSQTLAITGMTCASCVSHVEEALKKVPGVTEATVNLATERAEIILTDSEEASPEAVTRLGSPDMRLGRAPLGERTDIL